MGKAIAIAVWLGMVLGLAMAALAGEGGNGAPGPLANPGPTTLPAPAGTTETTIGTASAESIGTVAGSQPGEADRAAIERLVGNLGSRSRLVRESAQKRLVEIGLPAVRALRAAAESGNAEVRAQAMTILLAIARAREVCVKELSKVPQPFKDTHLFVSPDGEHVAYVLRPGGKKILVFDGNQGPAWDSILYTGPFSPDGKRFVYQAREGKDSFIVFAGEKKAPIPVPGTGRVVYSGGGRRFAYRAAGDGKSWLVCDGKPEPRYQRTGAFGFSRDGKRFAYVAQSGDDTEFVVLDGKALEAHKTVGSIAFSPDGKRFAYAATDANDAAFVVLDGKALEACEAVRSLVFSPDGKHLAYIARRMGNQMLVCDGRQWPGYARVFYPMFSADSTSLACWARSADAKQHFVIRDGRQIVQTDGEPRLVFSPDGKTLACSTWNGSQVYRLEEKVELLAAGQDAASDPVFSPDGRHIAYEIGKSKKWWVCVDGKDLAGQYDPESVMYWDGVSSSGSQMVLVPPGFSADGQHVYFKGFRGPPGYVGLEKREHFIVCDGVEGPPHEGLWIPSGLTNRTKLLRYVVRDGDRVRLMETAWPEPMTWLDAVE
jgi:Tol biopolymer transport system component